MATKFWGPLGWMALHSISAIYPENPTQEERMILEKFIDSFRESITCPHCKQHFTGMLNMYKRKHPEWSSSRYHFFLFVCRAHNTVNKRLDKPILQSLNDCIETLKNATKTTTPSQYRTAYINYLLSNWSREFTGDGAIALGAARQLKRINDEYFTPRDKGYENIYFFENGSVTEFISEDPRNYNIGPNLPNGISLPHVKIGFVGGRLKLR
jgi:FAD-linked sulfhydryl oxidase